MTPIKRDVVRSAPSLLHTVALVGRTKNETIQNIRRMDIAAPPSLYEPARQLVHAVLLGQSFEWALAQANILLDTRERKCAKAALATLERYLRSTRPTWFRPIEIEPYQLSPDVQIPVRVDGLMKVGGETRLLCLHLWQKRLEVEQARAAIGVFGDRLSRRSELVDSKLEFLDISVDPTIDARLFRRIGWDTYSQMSEYEIGSFMTRLLEAWEEYHLNPAEKPKPKPKAPPGQGDLFPQKKP